MTQPVQVRSGDAPTETVAAVVARLLAEQGLPAGEGEIGVDTPLTGLGVDSIGLVTLVSELERVFGVTFGPDDLQLSHFATVASLCELVAGHGGTVPTGAAAASASGSGEVAGPASAGTGRRPDRVPVADPEPAGYERFPVEGRLLMHLSHPRMSGSDLTHARAAITDRASGLDWARFLDLAGQHRVLHIVARNLAQARLGPPDAVRQALLRAAYLYNRNRNLALLDELRVLLAEFHAWGIDAIVRKGTYLTACAYPDIAMRFMVDLDLYVPWAQQDRYHQLMTELGYRQGDESPNGRLIEPLARDEEIFSRLYESALPPYWRPTSDPYVELFGVDASHDLMPPPSGKSLPAGDFLSRARREQVCGEPVWVPSDEDMLIDLGVHLYREAIWICSIEGGKDLCLIRFLDIVQWCGRAAGSLDSHRVVSLAHQYDLAPELYYALHFTDQLYPGVIPAELLAGLRPGDLSYLDRYGLLDNRPATWPTSFLDRLFDPARGAGITLAPVPV